MDQKKLTWRQYGQMGGRVTNFGAGRSQTEDEIRRGVQGKISFGKVIFSKSPIASSIGNVIGSNNNINLTLNVGIQQNTGSQTNGQITYATPKEVIERPADVSVGSETKNDLVVDETDARDKDNVIIVHDESEGEDAQKVEARE